MEAIPEVFGVEDSDELDESLQEDAQAAATAREARGSADGKAIFLLGRKFLKCCGWWFSWNHGISWNLD